MFFFLTVLQPVLLVLMPKSRGKEVKTQCAELQGTSNFGTNDFCHNGKWSIASIHTLTCEYKLVITSKS